MERREFIAAASAAVVAQALPAARVQAATKPRQP